MCRRTFGQPVDVESQEAELVIRIDADEIREHVFLPHGIQAGVKKVAIL